MEKGRGWEKIVVMDKAKANINETETLPFSLLLSSVTSFCSARQRPCSLLFCLVWVSSFFSNWPLSATISKRALLAPSQRSFQLFVSFSSFLIFFVICNGTMINIILQQIQKQLLLPVCLPNMQNNYHLLLELISVTIKIIPDI